MSRRLASLLITLTILGLAPGAVYADKIHLKSGRVMEGKVVEEKDGLVTIKTDKGITVSFDAALVVKIERGKTARERYDEQAGSATSIADHRRLARFCKAERMQEESRFHYQRILELAPDDREAREALDYIRSEQGWIRRADYMKGLGLVRYGNRWISEAERDLLEAAAEAKRDRSKVRRLVREAVRHKDPQRQERARLAIQKMNHLAVARPFRRILVSASKQERGFVLEDLQRRPRRFSFNKMYARSALADPVRALRESALTGLERSKDPNAALYFTSALGAESPILRINATAAIQRFPDARAVGSLIATLRFESGGFGRAHFVNLTQRAYIRDFELSSGGTGLTVAEVADPVIGGFEEGVVLDVHVKKVEWESKAFVLNFLTGQNFGTNQVAWRKWWKKHRDGFELTAEAAARRNDFLASKATK